MIFSFDKLRKCNDYKRDKSNFDTMIVRGGVKLSLTRDIVAPDITFLQILYFILLSTVITEI